MKKQVENTVKALTVSQMINQGNAVVKQGRFIFGTFNALKKETKCIYSGKILNADLAKKFKAIEKLFISNAIDLVGCATPEQLLKFFANGGVFTPSDVVKLVNKFEALEIPQRAVSSKFGTKFNDEILKVQKMEGANLHEIFQQVLEVGGKKALVKPSITIAKLVVKYAPQMVAKNSQIVGAFATAEVTALEGFEAHLQSSYKITATEFYKLAKANTGVTLTQIVAELANAKKEAEKAEKQAQKDSEKERKATVNKVGAMVGNFDGALISQKLGA